MDRLLTARKVAALLNLELATVYKWTSQGKIPHIKLSARAIRFSEAAIMHWLQNKTFGGNGGKPQGTCGFRKRRFTGMSERREDIEHMIRRAKVEVLVHK